MNVALSGFEKVNELLTTVERGKLASAHPRDP